MQGDVGIGETDPDEKLEVAGNILAKDAFVSAGLGAARGYQFHDFGTGWGYKAVTSSSRLGIFTDTAERVTIASNGQVGIGTTDPDKQLHISHATQPFLRLEESDSGGNKRLDLFVAGSTVMSLVQINLHKQ